jgi:hypothetical protein
MRATNGSNGNNAVTRKSNNPNQDSKYLHLFYLSLAVAYSIWAGYFIFGTSFISLDGNRYFSLVDDAMISMRYAWNFSHGHGLVWNPGERVEGYSNLLMTLIMSIPTAFLEKKQAVLAIQILGIPTVITAAFLSGKLTQLLLYESKSAEILAAIVFSGVLMYFPLSYWSLMGMEGGLITVLTLAAVCLIILWTRLRHSRALFLASTCLGLAFLARNDTIIFAAVCFAYIVYDLRNERKRSVLVNLIITFLIYCSFVVALLVFRQIYYGELVPNTYTLKLARVPLSVRINDGVLYVYQFIRETQYIIAATLIGLPFLKGRWKWFLAAFPVAAIGYTIWVGGDNFPLWRFILPSVPLLISLNLLSLKSMSESLFKVLLKNRLPASITFSARLESALPALILLILTAYTMSPYRSYMTLSEKTWDVEPNRHNMDVAIAINAATSEDAKIGVFWAGLIPYYTDRYAIDFLGKSDKYIAELYPRLPSKIVWFKRITYPGHNKYDLRYSIRELKPTYIQRFYWDQQSVRYYAIKHYVRFEYRDINGTITLILEKDSPDVYWDKGTIFLYPEQ